MTTETKSTLSVELLAELQAAMAERQETNRAVFVQEERLRLIREKDIAAGIRVAAAMKAIEKACAPESTGETLGDLWRAAGLR